MDFPDVELPSHDGRMLSPARAARAVVYFFPKAFTQGCTRETVKFNQELQKFRERGYEVFGISTDSVETLRKFAEKYGVGFPLLSDRGGALAARLGILKRTAERVTYILHNGRVVKVIKGLKRAEDHVDEALASI